MPVGRSKEGVTERKNGGESILIKSKDCVNPDFCDDQGRFLLTKTLILPSIRLTVEIRLTSSSLPILDIFPFNQKVPLVFSSVTY